MKISRNRYSYFAMLAIIGFVFLSGADSCFDDQNPSCMPEAIPLNSLLSPVGRLVSGDNIFVEWSYDIDEGQCQPDLYEVRFYEVGYPSAGPIYLEFTHNYETSFYADYIFQENTEYAWHVRGYSGSLTLSPGWSEKANFIILPRCPAEDLGQTTPIYPANDSRIQSSSVVFQIDTSLLACIPATYHLQVANIETMDDLIIDEYLSYFSLKEEIQLDPCQEYYWRVAGSESGIDGPFSDVFHFTIQNDECYDEPHAISTGDTPCRLGPGDEYDLGLYFLEGEEAPIIAKDLGEEWWKIETDGILCWVLRELTTSTGDTTNTPVHSPPDMKNSGDFSCRSNLSESMCEKAGGTYFERVTPPCVCP